MKTRFTALHAVHATAIFAFLPLLISNTSLVFSQAQLVKDINVFESPYFNEYSQLTNAQGFFYFVSNDKELWRSDGTTPGTKRVKVVRAIQNLALMGNVLYFSATDSTASELWKSDGTYAGTVRVKQFRRGPTSGPAKNFTSVNGTVFFVADNGTGHELWKTNGTLSGTVLVKDIRKGPEGADPSYLTVMNGLLYFSADDGMHGRELWTSDGTPGGTVMVKDIQTQGGESSRPMELVTLNSFLYFSARDSRSGRELWRSNGTTSGTIRLKDINPGTDSSGINAISRMGNAIYFVATNGTTGTALWRSSGTTAGTVLLKDLTSDNSVYPVTHMIVLNNRLYWVLRNNANEELWVSNGTAAGTRIATTFENSPATQFIYVGNKIFYYSSFFDNEAYNTVLQLNSINPDGSGWREIWKMQIPYSLDENLQYDNSPSLLGFNNALFFSGIRNGVGGYKLLKISGTETEPTVLIDTYRPTLSSSPTIVAKNTSGVYFTTWDTNASALWRTDGSRAGTIKINDSQTIKALSLANTLYFLSIGSTGNTELWKTNGTPTGTILLKELDPFYYLDKYILVDVGRTLFFLRNSRELWRTDGTAAGTIFLKTFAQIEHVDGSGTSAYMIVRNASGGQELWKSNGAPAGTVKVRTIRWVDGPVMQSEHTSGTLGNIFYFIGHDGTHGFELWRTDGTSTGTFMLKDIRTGDNGEDLSDIGRMTTFNNALYFTARDATGEFSLFRSDGTRTGTVKIHDSNRIFQYIPYKDRLLFVASDGYTHKLWSTDGTSSGTTLVEGFTVYSFWPEVRHAESNGILYLAQQPDNTIWRTDGTECGSFVIDVGVKDVYNLAFIGADLLFSAFHPYYGNELFSFDVTNVAAPWCPESLPSAHVTSDDSLDIQVTYNPNPFGTDFTIVINSNLQSTAEVAVYDMEGNPLGIQVVETGAPHQFGKNWREGLYIIRIAVDGRIKIARVVKRSH